MNKTILISVFFFLLISCHNPFAPKLSDGSELNSQLSVSQQTIDGFFESFKSAYTFRDTTIYGKLLSPDFIFTYQDFDRGVDVSWGREEDMRATHGLFVNSEQLELSWNYFRDYQIDSLEANISRSFKLRVTFSSTDVVQGEGNVRFKLQRPSKTADWKLVRWQDESNF